MSDPGVVAGIEQLKGLPIWNVNAGGAAGSSFSLAFGGRVLRAKPLKNPNVSQEFRENDLSLITSAGTLCVFCDHVPPEMSYRINWELTLPNAVVSVGPGFAFEITDEAPTAPTR